MANDTKTEPRFYYYCKACQRPVESFCSDHPSAPVVSVVTDPSEVDLRIQDEIESRYRYAEGLGFIGGRKTFSLTKADCEALESCAGRRPTDEDVRQWRRAFEDLDDQEKADRSRAWAEKALLGLGFERDPAGAGMIGWMRREKPASQKPQAYALVTEEAGEWELGIYDDDDNRIVCEVYPTAEILIHAMAVIFSVVKPRA